MLLLASTLVGQRFGRRFPPQGPILADAAAELYGKRKLLGLAIRRDEMQGSGTVGQAESGRE